MIALRKYSLFALASAALFIGFFGGGGFFNIAAKGSWDVRCHLFPEASLRKEIAQCEKVLEEQVYEGEALGEVYFRLGYFHHQLDEWQIALEYYQKARKMRPERTSAHLNAAGLLGRHMKDWKAVVDATTDVIDLIPPVKSHHSDAWIMRAIALIILGRGDEAVADIKVAQTIDPDRKELSFLLENLDEIQLYLAKNKNWIEENPSQLDLKDTFLLTGQIFLRL